MREGDRGPQPRPLEFSPSFPFCAFCSRLRLGSQDRVGAILPEISMSTKHACVIPTRWTLGDYALHTCSDRSHAHLSRAEYDDNLSHGLVELLRGPDHRLRRKAVVRAVRTLPVRGLSCTVGEALVLMLADDRGRGVAKAMLAQIKMRREAPS
jgi:hypothetical protein